MITYRLGNDLDLDQVIELYKSCTLGGRRPVDKRDYMEKMLRQGNLTVTAWDGEVMVGLSRSLTDFCYVTYLSDLAVRESYQRRGIGKELIRQTQLQCTPDTRLVLLSAPQAVDYYPRIGFVRHEQCWQLPPGQTVT